MPAISPNRAARRCRPEDVSAHLAACLAECQWRSAKVEMAKRASRRPYCPPPGPGVVTAGDVRTLRREWLWAARRAQAAFRHLAHTLT